MKFLINALEGKNTVTYYADDVDMFEQHANTALERGRIVSIEAEYVRETPIEVVRVAKDCGVPIVEMKEQPVIELSDDDEPEFIIYGTRRPANLFAGGIVPFSLKRNMYSSTKTSYLKRSV